MLWSWFAELLFWLCFDCRLCPELFFLLVTLRIYFNCLKFPCWIRFTCLYCRVNMLWSQSLSPCYLFAGWCGCVVSEVLVTFGKLSGCRNSTKALVCSGWLETRSGRQAGRYTWLTACILLCRTKETPCKDVCCWSAVHLSTEPHQKTAKTSLPSQALMPGVLPDCAGKSGRGLYVEVVSSIRPAGVAVKIRRLPAPPARLKKKQHFSELNTGWRQLLQVSLEMAQIVSGNKNSWYLWREEER